MCKNYDYMKSPGQSNILVVGTARDVEKGISSTIFRLSSALKDFRQVEYLICESHSTDQTLKTLEALSLKVKNFYFKSVTQSSNANWSRTQRIAFARNFIIEQIRLNYSHFDYVCVVDLDSVNRGITTEGIRSCWKYDDWSMMSANQPSFYYDIYALRHSD